ncbi:MAG: hypothetical protein ABFD92_10050 [Planctomycetaceae bacterium]|nr:hypothetical protein [Planctomycetaceae bacterium]
MSIKRTLSLEKQGHTYLFTYAPGSENQIIDELMRLADDEQCTLDWMDAASLSFQVAQGVVEMAAASAIMQSKT